jgi:HEPN superfamily AbiU2-like protein
MKRLREEIRGLADDANEKTQFARDWRNRRLAHIELSVGDIAKPLASATLDQVESALAAIRRPINVLEKHYLGTPVLYEDPIPALGGVDSLLATLNRGVNARHIEREIKLGKHLARARE